MPHPRQAPLWFETINKRQHFLATPVLDVKSMVNRAAIHSWPVASNLALVINLKRLLNVIKEWYTTWISCNSLHAWLWTHSRLIAMVCSLIAWRLVRPQTQWWHWRSFSLLVGAWCLSLAGPTVAKLQVFFSSICESGALFFVSPCIHFIWLFLCDDKLQ